MMNLSIKYLVKVYYVLACSLNTYFECRDELNAQLTIKDKNMYIAKNYYSKFILIFWMIFWESQKSTTNS